MYIITWNDLNQNPMAQRIKAHQNEVLTNGHGGSLVERTWKVKGSVPPATATDSDFQENLLF